MQTWQIIFAIIIILFLPTIIFKFIDAKKLGNQLDNLTKKIKARDKKYK